MAKKHEPQRPRGRPRSDPSSVNRSVFYTKDPEVEQIIAAIIELLRNNGLPGVSGNQAISWALHQAAKVNQIGPYQCDDKGWPWCDACQSFHHPDNPNCRSKTGQPPLKPRS